MYHNISRKKDSEISFQSHLPEIPTLFILTDTVVKSLLKTLIVMTMAQMQSTETVVLIQIGIT